MAKCPVCGEESFTIERRLLDRLPRKGEAYEKENRPQFAVRERAACRICYEKYLHYKLDL